MVKNLREKQGLDALEKYPGGGPAERVIDVLFGSQPPSAAGTARIPAIPSPGPGAPASVMAKLNDSQRDAVAFALATRDVALIHGPPGECLIFAFLHVQPAVVIVVLLVLGVFTAIFVILRSKVRRIHDK